jgi:hypothetical protein
MKAKRIKKLDNGLYGVTVMVSENVIRFAQLEAKRGGYLGPADYLNGVLNTAMLREMENEPLAASELQARTKAVVENEGELPF